VDHIHPAENAALAVAIAGHGLRVSEQPPGLDPQARHFPMRNRIIAGLVRAVVVVEAAARSGSLITAQMALDQGREVLAVPGHPLDARASGCNALIRDGAVLVRGAEDVLAVLGQPAPAPDKSAAAAPAPTAPAIGAAAPPRPASDLHRHILDRLGPSPLAEDQLIRDLALPAATVAPHLLALEMEGLILRQPGGLLARTV
ncbi:DNA-processing protein DprA, partial [Candidatus Falkowbacteria bacterium]|nr:DNA-processing protein DprA [Candidatus Falkowbacteria bacterium]